MQGLSDYAGIRGHWNLDRFASLRSRLERYSVSVSMEVDFHACL